MRLPFRLHLWSVLAAVLLFAIALVPPLFPGLSQVVKSAIHEASVLIALFIPMQRPRCKDCPH